MGALDMSPLEAVLFLLWLRAMYLILRPSPVPTPLLLKLPPECLLLIRDELSSSHDSIVPLSLTCKALFRLFASDLERYRGKHSKALLLLLERDMGHRFFYCPPCSRLHVFSSTWSPMHLKHHPCDYNQVFHPNYCSNYYLRFMQAHLVMNRHIHGPPRGLALKTLEKTFWVMSWGDGLMWKNESSAKIIGTDLFLRVVHTIEGKASNVRDAIDEGRHSVCRHVTTDSVDQVHGYTRCLRSDHTIGALQDPQANERRCGLATLLGQPSVFFRECKDVPGSCPVCLTDYTTTIERAKVTETYWKTRKKGSFFKPSFNGLRVSITVYHQLGSCRNTDDWRWQALLAMSASPYREIECRSSSPRNLRRYPPGIVRRAWQIQEQRPETRWKWFR